MARAYVCMKIYLYGLDIIVQLKLWENENYQLSTSLKLEIRRIDHSLCKRIPYLQDGYVIDDVREN